ncbi:putative membrane protein [Nostocoides japonicum T1-X7]|uniref:Putative membrane protein n=1 Tax=Nostocoides japonicum T1-X7 TaxID=1194083 RepID=A0A077LWM0_9MICO|nr:LytR C-terminal domain-containing protein [Tetrasphaera japonica]CCH77217.1 putative membrane protein [Tetrasphaera japonica T1-X7]
MSDYLTESDLAEQRHRSRRRRTAISLSVVVLILFGAFWYSYSYFKGSSGDASATPTTVCSGGKPVKVTVNVYNATTRQGLAADTASTLRKRGFTIGSVANDPLHKTIKASAQVRYGPAGVKLAPVVGATVSKPVMVKDKRKSATVDLVLGNGFKALTAARAVSVTSCTTQATK